jgi:hypothetical protein
LQHKADEDFASNIVSNTSRYIKLFEEVQRAYYVNTAQDEPSTAQMQVADALMPQPTRADVPRDVFDVLEVCAAQVVAPMNLRMQAY